MPEHLRITREEPINERRTRPGFPRLTPPHNPAAHGRFLLDRLQTAKLTATTETIGGFDERKLIKFEIAKEIRPEDLQNIPGVELVSQEGRTVALVFATDRALEDFEARLTTLANGNRPTRREILYALSGVDVWSEEDRKGWALRQEGLPTEAAFMLDTELWPLSNQLHRGQMIAQFEQWLTLNDINQLDRVQQASLIMYRVSVNREQAGLLLRHRDVRTVDLPPNFGIEQGLLQLDIQTIPPPPQPPDNAPAVTVLDSGIASGHPLLASAFGDAQNFIPDIAETGDESGHGTHIAGIALYGDVERCMQARTFVPTIRIFSGKILDHRNENNTGFVENHIAEAVRYFRENYGCRIFNLSFGDRRKPYRGAHVSGMAVTLDTLARNEEVLFVVSSGNFEGVDDFPNDWLREYPEYLFSEEARLIDPAPALNVLTVGSIARWDQTINSQRYTYCVEEIPIARHDQPSSFTRSGPSVNNAIKPDLVAYGGNQAVDTRAGGRIVERGLGELSVHKDFTQGRPWSERSGTSFAAPHVAHLAARLLGELPGAHPNLIRALLVAHAVPPIACKLLFADDEAKLKRVCGYGQVQEDALFRSTEDQVTLYTSDSIADKRHHFYEVPIPEDFYSPGRRRRELNIALAYSPAVRTTRIDYKASKISFKLVEAANLDAVIASFNAATAANDHEGISEFLPLKRSMSERDRSNGTVQACTWAIGSVSDARRQKKLFVVVTRNDPTWGEGMSAELEAYSLVICLRDQEAQNARLYSQIRVQLQARARARLSM
ncbi:MAG: S8 family peptidase [Desulfuromonadaceae bacterium]|nr:S8 family peptidase [Desulfuromonadaceae bacterium]MDD2847193.1 S8 family peptidase [Desulfuromonadaceae bacterium]MDD4130137.1 S8 family peptidase [Desulfuromonadaceae bacterium]